MAYWGVFVSVEVSVTVEDLLCDFAVQTRTRKEEYQIFFRGTPLENHKRLDQCGIKSGDLHLQPLGNEKALAVHDQRPRNPIAVVPAEAVDKNGKMVSGIRITSKEKPKYLDITFDTIRLSDASHAFSRDENHYAGFILYAWEDKDGVVKDEWWLNRRHCKSAYFVIQGTDSPNVKRYIGKAPGKVHGAVYWNVFGEDEDVKKAVGEGFAFEYGKYKWNSTTFNANKDAYHDGIRQISDLAGKCVTGIIKDWKRISLRGQTSWMGKTYSVEDLLSMQ